MPNVALDIGLTVISVQARRIDFFAVQARHKALIDQFVARVGDAGCFEFCYRQGQQAQEGRASGEGLSNGFLQTQLVAAGENVLPALPAAVREDLDG